MLKQKAIIFDLDGTICDDSHRLPLLTENEGNITDKIWDQYHGCCIEDNPIEVVASCAKGLAYGYWIIIITGRDEKYREATLNWLFVNNVPHQELYMRPNGNHCSSVDLKRKIYHDHIKNKYDVIGVFEDRKCVVDMWREEGLICLQTQEENY